MKSKDLPKKHAFNSEMSIVFISNFVWIQIPKCIIDCKGTLTVLNGREEKNSCEGVERWEIFICICSAMCECSILSCFSYHVKSKRNNCSVGNINDTGTK